MSVEDLPDIDKAALCYMNNELLKAHGVSLPMTQEQIDEITRVSNDILYFVKNYVKIMTLGKGVQYFALHDYQEEWIEACQNNRFVMGKWSRQSGKCVSPETTIRVRNKQTGEEKTVTIKDFFDSIK